MRLKRGTAQSLHLVPLAPFDTPGIRLIVCLCENAIVVVVVVVVVG